MEKDSATFCPVLPDSVVESEARVFMLRKRHGRFDGSFLSWLDARWDILEALSGLHLDRVTPVHVLENEVESVQ